MDGLGRVRIANVDSASRYKGTGEGRLAIGLNGSKQERQGCLIVPTGG